MRDRHVLRFGTIGEGISHVGTVRAGLLCVVFACVAISGCGGPTRLPVSGVVQFSDGEPVRTGVIEFRGGEGDWRASGKLSRDGRFELAAVDGGGGLPAGEYEVIVAQVIMTDLLPLKQHTHGRSVPRRYSDYYSSGLRHTLTAENASQVVIEVEPE